LELGAGLRAAPSTLLSTLAGLAALARVAVRLATSRLAALSPSTARRSDSGTETAGSVIHRPGEHADHGSGTAAARSPIAQRLGQAVAVAYLPGDPFEVRIVRARLPLVVDLVRRQFPLFF